LNLEERKEQCEVLVKYVKETFHMHNFYALKYFICDILNFVNVIGQISPETTSSNLRTMSCLSPAHIASVHFGLS